MRTLVTILIMALYGLGNVIFPNVDASHMQELYQHCAVEDPDINLADFICEHILSIPEFFEGNEAGEEGEKPHQAIYQTAGYQIAVIPEKPALIPVDNRLYIPLVIQYSNFRNGYFPTGIYRSLLRPPIV